LSSHARLVGLSVVYSNEDHLAPLDRPTPAPSPRAPAVIQGISDLGMTSHQPSREAPDQQGHDLDLRLKA